MRQCTTRGHGSYLSFGVIGSGIYLQRIRVLLCGARISVWKQLRLLSIPDGMDRRTQAYSFHIPLNSYFILCCRGLVVRAATLTREVAGCNPGKSHWWTTGRASGPKMLTAPSKSQLTIGHRPSPVKTGSV